MTLLEISHSLRTIKDHYMALSRNAIFRYAKIVQSTGDEDNRYANSTRESCDAS